MRIMTFNILEGGDSLLGGRTYRRDLIARIIRAADADVVALQECTDWEKDDQKVLHDIERMVGMLAMLALTDGFPVALLVKPELSILNADAHTRGFWHGMLDVVIADADSVPTRLLNAHLHPRDPDIKLAEIKEIISHHQPGERTVLMGDLNTLSHLDHLDASKLAEQTLARHTKDGELDFRVTKTLEAHGFVDAYAAFHLGERRPTIPTAAARDSEFSPVRMDYIFVSRELKSSLVSCELVESEDAQIASDHFPLLLEISDPPTNGAVRSLSDGR